MPCKRIPTLRQDVGALVDWRAFARPMRRTLPLLIALALSAYLALPLPGLSAPLSHRIEKKRAQVEKATRRAGVLTQTLAGYDLRLEALQGDIRITRRRLARVQDTLDEKRAELLELRDRLEIARARLEALRRRLAVARRTLAARLVEMYKADEPDLLTVVLEADGFADLLERAEFLERIAKQDREVLDRVRVLKRRAESMATELARLEQRIEVAATDLLERRDDIAATTDRLAGIQVELRGARGRRRSALAQVRGSRARAQEDLRALEAEQAEVARTLRAAARPASPSPAGSLPAGPVHRGSGQLIWPINGPITSPFGLRWGRLHAGVDISAPEGTPIRAGDSGRVVVAGWQGGFGLYTCIQHSAAISTCYAHQSRLGTSTGASVGQGQVMGYVGNTGNSFGAHLHFEVRVSGSPVDPLGYL